MKFLILNFLFVFAFGNTNAYVNVLPAINDDFILIEEELPIGVVSIQDLILRVDTQNSALLVDEIKIFNQSGNLVMQITGCNAQECFTDISSLVTGTYDVTVKTVSGYTFSGTITL